MQPSALRFQELYVNLWQSFGLGENNRVLQRDTVQLEGLIDHSADAEFLLHEYWSPLLRAPTGSQIIMQEHELLCQCGRSGGVDYPTCYPGLDRFGRATGPRRDHRRAGP